MRRNEWGQVYTFRETVAYFCQSVFHVGIGKTLWRHHTDGLSQQMAVLGDMKQVETQPGQLTELLLWTCANVNDSRVFLWVVTSKGWGDIFTDLQFEHKIIEIYEKKLSPVYDRFHMRLCY